MRPIPPFRTILALFVLLLMAAYSGAGSPVQAGSPYAASARLLGTYVEPQYIGSDCAAMQSVGARFTWIALPWIGVEPAKGVFDWHKADPIIFGAHDCGFDVGLHLLSVSSWATDLPPATGGAYAPSMPPRDPADYYQYVFHVAQHYRGVVSRYSIENEAHATVNWPSSPATYFDMLRTAYRAVKAADPRAKVEDAGLSSSALGLLVAQSMLQQGRTTEATDFARNYFAHYPAAGGEAIVVSDPGNLEFILSQPESQRLLKWAPLLFSNRAYYDVLQVHYFGPWQQLTAVTAYLHSHLRAAGGDRKLDFWEMGYGWNDMTSYDPEAHARDLVKLFATALGEGGQRALHWQYDDHAISEGHPGLIAPDGPRPAASAFELAAGKLNGVTAATRLSLGPGVYAYRFKQGTRSVFVLWSEQPATVRLPVTATSVQVTDLGGQISFRSPRAVPVGPSPVFAEPR